MDFVHDEKWKKLLDGFCVDISDAILKLEADVANCKFTLCGQVEYVVASLKCMRQLAKEGAELNWELPLTVEALRLMAAPRYVQAICVQKEMLDAYAAMRQCSEVDAKKGQYWQHIFEQKSSEFQCWHSHE